jgi:hypothetical protein
VAGEVQRCRPPRVEGTALRRCRSAGALATTSPPLPGGLGKRFVSAPVRGAAAGDRRAHADAGVVPTRWGAGRALRPRVAVGTAAPHAPVARLRARAPDRASAGQCTCVRSGGRSAAARPDRVPAPHPIRDAAPGPAGARADPLAPAGSRGHRGPCAPLLERLERALASGRGLDRRGRARTDRPGRDSPQRRRLRPLGPAPPGWDARRRAAGRGSGGARSRSPARPLSVAATDPGRELGRDPPFRPSGRRRSGGRRLAGRGCRGLVALMATARAAVDCARATAAVRAAIARAASAPEDRVPEEQAPLAAVPEVSMERI